ncbi:hypothetical protein LPB41_20915 [Thalassospira sp. MA62]|nr:hypothetical protein [Thalassospira sp. MA62]
MTLPPQAISPGNAVGGQASTGGSTHSAGQNATPAQVTATVSTATSQQVAAALAKLPVETLLQASVQSQSGNQLTLATALGQVSVKLPTQLPGNLGDMIWARIPTSNQGTGQMPGGTPGEGMRLQLLPHTMTSGAGGSGGIASGNIAGTTLTPGQSFSAVTTSSLTMPNGSQLPAGSQTQVIFLGQGTVSAQQASQVLNVGAGGNAAGMVNISPGGAMIGAIPGAQAAGGALPGSSLILTGTVLPPDSPEARNLPQGFTALRTGAGIVGIKLPVPAPAGATLSFSIDTASTGKAAPSMPMTEADLITRGQTAALSRDWGNLQSAIHALQQHDPGAAMSLLNNLPSPGPKLTTTMMFFFAAMNGPGGNLRGWLGDRASNSLSALGDRDGGLLKKLEGDFGQLRNIAADDRPDGWRVMAMPFNMGEKIEQVQLAWRQGGHDDDDGEDEDPGTRFLLDLSFSQVGHTQLDGLVKGEDNQFDLIIRTENQLQSQNRDDIRGIFREALQISGYKGHLLFQDGSRFVDIAPPAPDNTHRAQHGIEA